QHAHWLALARLIGIADDGAASAVEGDAVATFERLFGCQRAQPYRPALQGCGPFPHPSPGESEEPLPQRLRLLPPQADPLVGRLVGPLQPTPAFLQRPFALTPD